MSSRRILYGRGDWMIGKPPPRRKKREQARASLHRYATRRRRFKSPEHARLIQIALEQKLQGYLYGRGDWI